MLTFIESVVIFCFLVEVVTFDGGGVSGHINHRSLHSSLCYLLEERLLPPGERAGSGDGTPTLIFKEEGLCNSL